MRGDQGGMSKKITSQMSEMSRNIDCLMNSGWQQSTDVAADGGGERPMAGWWGTTAVAVCGRDGGRRRWVAGPTADNGRLMWRSAAAASVAADGRPER
ncbi:hypothetical protein LWI28_013398 [Acer negundo]|uniref:Uncharacterized protein n=1 Tax=Acer negundo TaxID=4023 RepID=A0AAD5IZV6_ACENE|nr:hypothetical protein LWI28_013398 [Acer negundo]